MLRSTDFELSLEKQLKLKIIFDDIDRCKDVEILQNSLKQVSEQLMKYQHLLGKVLEEQLLAELEKWDIEASTIVKEANNNSDA